MFVLWVKGLAPTMSFALFVFGWRAFNPHGAMTPRNHIAVRFGRYVFNELVRWASYEGPHSLGRIFILCKSLKIESVVRRRLDFLKAVRFGSYVSNKLVWWASCEGLHSLGRIFLFRHILENQICDPASAGFFEGRQIWEIPFKRTCLVGFMRMLI